MRSTRRDILAGASSLLLSQTGYLCAKTEGDNLSNRTIDLRVIDVRASRPRLIATSDALRRMTSALQTNSIAKNWRALFETRMGETFFDPNKPSPPLSYPKDVVDRNFHVLADGGFQQDILDDFSTPSIFLDSSNALRVLSEETNELRLLFDETSKDFNLYKHSLQPKGNEILEYARVALTRIHALGLLALMTRNSQHIERAKTELMAICKLPTWGKKYLAHATFTHAAALGYDWLHSALSDDERSFIARIILDRGIERGLQEFYADPQPRWLTSTTIFNWNVVCNSAMMIAAIAVFESDRDRCSRLFNLSYNSLLKGLANYAPDGSWKLEGPGYWHLATEHLVYLLDGLDTCLGTDLRLSELPGLELTGAYRTHIEGPTQKLFNFGDGADTRPELWWMLWLARRYDKPVYGWMEETRLGLDPKPSAVHPMDLLWCLPSQVTVSPKETEALDVIYPGAGVGLLRSAWGDKDAIFLGVKAGINVAGRSHSHLDLGSFVIDSEGIRWGVELGPDQYSQEYFDYDTRYSFYNASTLGQNAVVFNHGNQKCPASAPIISHEIDTHRSTLSVNLTDAYPDCASYIRKFAMFNRQDIIILDEIVPRRLIASISWQMHTAASVETSGPVARLSDLDTRGPALFLHILEPRDARFNVIPAEAPAQNGVVFRRNFYIPNVHKLVIESKSIENPHTIIVFFSAKKINIAVARALIKDLLTNN